MASARRRSGERRHEDGEGWSGKEGTGRKREGWEWKGREGNGQKKSYQAISPMEQITVAGLTAPLKKYATDMEKTLELGQELSGWCREQSYMIQMLCSRPARGDWRKK